VSAHLVVIDMQDVFADPGSEWATPRFGEILPTVRTLVEAFAPAVTFTRFVAPAEPAGAWRDYYQQWPFALVPPDSPIYDVVPALGETGPTVAATTFSKWGAQLAGRVGTDTMVLAGVSTDCCVMSTAVAAADAGVPVRVVSDACAGVDDESHAAALHVLGLYGPLVEVVDAKTALTLAPGGAP
jgi:nicotinamidase-related amidase